MRNSMMGLWRRGNAGYSLIETAIVIAVVGALIASFGTAYSLYVQHKIQAKTELNASLITSALSNYLVQKGRYPCPARLNAQRSDADYGVETQCDPSQADYPSGASFGTCLNGVCFEQSDTYISILNYMNIRLAGGIGCYQGSGNANKNKLWCPGASGSGTIPARITIEPPVRRGAVPFRTLALPEDASYDGYDDRFQYAVSENQAVTDAYEPNKGAIKVLNSQGQAYFNVTMSPPILRPSAINSITNFAAGATYTAVNEKTASPKTSPGTDINVSGAMKNTDFIYATANTMASVEFKLSIPTSTPYPGGNATLSFIAAGVNSTGTSLQGAGNIKPVITLKQNGTAILGPTSGTPSCAANLSKFQSVWTQVDCVFDSSIITDWNNLAVVIANDSAANNKSWAIGWVQLQTPIPKVGYTDYFLFSVGKDRAGGYTYDGQLRTACATATLDAPNCSTKSSAQYRMADENDAYVADATMCNTTNCHYDDYVKFFSSTETPLWRISDASASIRDLLAVENAGGQIAIAQPTDGANVLLEVGGEVHAESSNAMMSKACDITGSNNCFTVSSLVDPVAQAANFTCPRPGNPGHYATGFSNGTLTCSDTPSMSCPTGSIMTGINPDGSPICTSAVGCPAMTINLCFNNSTGNYDTTTIPSGIQNQNYTTPNSGFNYVETWQCGPNPWWSKTGSSGICNCTPVDETYDVPCNTRRTGNWTGTITIHHTHTCPDDTDNGGVEVSNTCACSPTTETSTDATACGTGFTGSITSTRDWTCTDTTTGSYTAWTVTSNTCTCQAQSDETRVLSCPTQPSTGEIDQSRSWTCPAGTWSSWTDTSNTCACQNGATESQDLGCPGGYTGQHTQSRTYDCSTSTWSNWTDTVNTCACTPATRTQTLSCQTAYTGSITQHQDFTCPAGTWGSWVTDSNTCTCTGASQTQTVACDSPLAGTKTQQRDYDCGSNTWGAWYDTTLNCYANTYTWTPKTAADGPYATPLSIHAGSTCTTSGDQAPCSAQAASGLGYYHYANCMCE